MSESYSYSVLFVREVLNALEAHGANRNELMTRTGLRPSMLKNLVGRLPDAYVEDLFSSAIAQVPHEDWGLRIAQHLSENSQRLTTLILFTAPSIRAGLERARRFQHLNTTRGWFTLTDDPDSEFVIVRLHMPDLDLEGTGRQMIEATIGTVSRYVDRFAGDDAIPGHVSFQHQPIDPTDLSMYEKFFRGREVRFGAPHDELTYLRENLDKHSPLAQYNRQIHAEFMRRAEALYRGIFSDSDIETKVREELKSQLKSRPEDVSLESVAEALKMTSRSLQRKLGKAGFSYNELADDERKALFLEMVVDDSISFSEMGRRCGFRSRESLYRSVKRWYGATPAEVRNRMIEDRAS